METIAHWLQGCHEKFRKTGDVIQSNNPVERREE